MLKFSPCCHPALFTALCLVVVPFAGFAQKDADKSVPIKFGKIAPQNFSKSTLDSTAEAVVLYQYGEAVFDIRTSNLVLTCTYHTRIQIRKKSAYDRATIQLPTRRGSNGIHEHVTSFDGYTYNMTNGVVAADRLTKTGHFTERASDKLWIEKYTLPNVREGSIIEYQYTVSTPFAISYNPPTWHFQQDIPVQYSEYNVQIPNSFYYQIKQSGYLPIKTGEQNMGSNVAHRYVVQNAPAFRKEAYITTPEDYTSKIEFELASYQLPGQMLQNLTVGWDALDKTLLNDANFGGQMNRVGFLREKAKAIMSQYADTLGRVTAAYDFIRQTIQWNDGSSIWTSNLKKVFDDKKGDAADINIMLIALLREMNIDANPVLLSTRSHGRVDESYPLLRKFNYVVGHVSVGGKELLLDATDPHLRPGMLPTHCLNNIGRLVHPTKGRFVSLSPTERDIELQTGVFSIDSDGEISGKLAHSHGGYSAWSARKQFTADGKTKYTAGIQKKRSTWQIEKVDFLTTDAKSNVFNLEYTITIPEACSKAGDRLYFRPLLTEAHESNPFKEVERLYPVDFGVPIEETFTATYTLPEGYQIEDLPKPASMILPEDGGRFLYQVVPNGTNQLQVVSRITLRKPMYYTDEYGGLRELFSRIVAKHAEPIVLKRGTVAEKK